MINLSFRVKFTLKASEKLDIVNSFISIVAALENTVERVAVTPHLGSDCHVLFLTGRWKWLDFRLSGGKRVFLLMFLFWIQDRDKQKASVGGHSTWRRRHMIMEGELRADRRVLPLSPSSGHPVG